MLSRRRQKIRWTVASALDRLPGMCWSSLVSWALHMRPLRQTRRDDSCRQDAAGDGHCYCGRLCTAGGCSTCRG